jgi:hypothetical protein
MPDTEIQIRSIERIHYQTKGKGEKKMKTRKHFVGMAIAIIALAFAIIGCQQDEPTSTSTPQEVPIGNVGGIPIYGVNSETAITNLKSAYNSTSFDSSAKSKLSSGIKKIYILEGTELTLYSFDSSTGVLKVASEGTPGTYVDCFRDIVLPQLS